MYFIKKDFFKNIDKKEKGDVIIALVVITFFSFYVYKLIYRTIKKEKVENLIVLKEDQKKGVFNTEVEVEVSHIFTNSELDVYIRKKIKAEDAYLKEVNTAIVISDFIEDDSEDINDFSSENEFEEIQDLEIEEGFIEMLEEEAIYEVETKVTFLKDNLIETEVEEDIVIKEEDSPLVLEEVKIIEKVKDTEEAKEVILEAQIKPDVKETISDCVIVVGAFKEVNNKVNIIEKLNSLGYPYAEGILRKDLNYVGVPVTCNDVNEKQRLLKELNTIFGIESWVKKK